MATELPRIEARVRAQERLTTILHARIEELAQDVDESFQQLVAYQIQTEHKIEKRFDQVDARFDKVDARLDKVESDIAGVKTDIATMESRILNAFQQLVTIIDTRLPPAIDR